MILKGERVVTYVQVYLVKLVSVKKNFIYQSNTCLYISVLPFSSELRELLFILYYVIYVLNILNVNLDFLSHNSDVLFSLQVNSSQFSTLYLSGVKKKEKYKV